MTYARLNKEATEILKLGPRPTWKVGGKPAPDYVLRAGAVELGPDSLPMKNPDGTFVTKIGEERYFPVHHDRPAHDPNLQRLEQKPKSEWLIEPERVVAIYDIVEIDIEELRQAKLQAATDMRWSVMTGGLTLPGGIAVGTTIDDQNRITSVVANAELAGLTDSNEVDFKAESGWVRITIAEVKTIAGAIGQHVQACYSAERAHHEAIELLTTREQIRDYDISVGWPDMQPETEST